MTTQKNRTKTRTAALTIFLLTLSIFAGWASAALGAEGDKNKGALKACVVYDAEYRFGGEEPMPTSLREYLGHFNLDIRELSVREWTPGALNDAEIIFYLGIQDEVLPGGLVKEIALAAGTKRVVWMERGIGQLSGALQWKDFSFRGLLNGWTAVQNRFGRRTISEWMQIGVAQPGAEAEIFTRVLNVAGEEALSWRRGNVYYLGRLDFFAMPIRAALVDILYRAVPETHTPAAQSPRMLLRVEDVNPYTNPEALRGVLGTIEAAGIPYAIAVISRGVAADGTNVLLGERPALVEILKGAQERGASIIMHGYAHSNEFSPLTGEGFEFWNARDDCPMPDDEAFTRKRIELAFRELARCGLYPVAFEPPHYAMSKRAYEALSEYFNVFSGMIQTTDETYTISMTTPFITKSPRLNGMLFIPENMGYYDGNEFRVDNLLHNAAVILETNAPFATFFYHGYLEDVEPLRAAIEGSLRMGYTFFDLRTLDIRAGSSQVAITTGDGRINAVILDPALRLSMQADKANEGDPINMAKFIWVQACLMAISLAGILCLILYLRKTAWKKYEVS